ncbi:IucA/IucC family protein [Saccharomonospora sp. NPDC006951]
MSALELARREARQRLLNCYLRETRQFDVPQGKFRIRLARTGAELVVDVVSPSPFGHHRYGPDTDPDHDQLVTAILRELAATTGFAGVAELRRQIGNSIARTARYLGNTATDFSGSPHEVTRKAEQSLRLGHPFHPTPKSAEGFTEADLARYAPELGAIFALHYFAVADEVIEEVKVAEASWVPDEVAAATPDGYTSIPAHPWQAGYLLGTGTLRGLIAADVVRPLGPLGKPVYPTSSVRTVCDPEFPTAWKLPLHVRITNFVRTNPAEHLRRATEAAAVVATLPSFPGFSVLSETGSRTVGAADDELRADLGVLYRDNPFAHNGEAPRVLGALLENPRTFMREVLSAGDVHEWLRDYLAIMLRPQLRLFADYGIVFEAHAQNTLLCMENGHPCAVWLRDLEGAAVSSEGKAAEGLGDDSPLRCSRGHAVRRLTYHAVTGQLGHLIDVLGRYSRATENDLWREARHCLAEWDEADELLSTRELPAKANLTSRFAGKGERPSYVTIPNPLWEPR